MPNQEEPKNLHQREATDLTRKGRTLTRADFLRIAGAAGAVAAIVGTEPPRVRAQPRRKLDTPRIQCTNTTQATIFLQVCAGPSGAPAGFSVQWMPLPPDVACPQFVWPASDDPALCKASFSGVPGCSDFNLGSNQCITVEIGNLDDSVCGVSTNCSGELQCGTTYVFRAFAHNVPGGLNRSDFTPNVCCSTEDCFQQSCVRTQGFWKTHGPLDCNPSGGPNVWPVTELTIGDRTYSDAELCANLNKPGGGNAVLILSHQLIAALLNIASGAAEPTNCDISAASTLLTGLNINTGSVDPHTDLGKKMLAAAECLDLYNTGDGGVPHCP
jgi:hypothetical protein